MTAYQAGKRFEDKVRGHLREEGYVVIRSAGSKTKVDLTCLKPGQLLLIQCKRTGVIQAAEWDELLELAGWVGAVPLLAVNGPKGRGICLWQLCGPKRRGLPWPKQPVHRFVTDEVVGVRQEWVEIP